MKLKKIIIILIIVAVILLGVIILLKKEKNISEEKFNPAIEEITVPINETLQIEESRNNFYTVQNCINTFYTYYERMYIVEDFYLTTGEDEEKNLEEIRVDSAKRVYNLLDEEYLEYKGITQENIAEKLFRTDKWSISIRDMYVIQKSKNIYAYFIYGVISDGEALQTDNFSIMLKLDAHNRTYKVLLQDYLEENYNNITLGKTLEINFPTEIEKNDYNTYKYQIMLDKKYASDLFINYKRNVMYYQEYAYEQIDEKYKNIRFVDVNEYLTHIEENYEQIRGVSLESYNITKKDSYTQYLFKDNSGNYYIFNETAPFQYTVILDTYTLPTEEFIETYNNSTDAQKVVLNIKKFFMGIDDKNYGYSYSLLADSFKSNKYPTKNDFVNFAKQNFFEENEIEYVRYEVQNGVYIYNINITDATGNSQEQKALNIIVKLNDGTDFEMSFGTD